MIAGTPHSIVDSFQTAGEKAVDVTFSTGTASLPSSHAASGIEIKENT